MKSYVRMGFSVALFAGLVALSVTAFAQPGRGGPGGRGPGGPGGFGGGFGGFGGGGNDGGMGLLRDENVQKDLELVDEQKTKLTALAEKVREDMRAQFQGFDFGSLRDLSEEERTAKFAEMREKSQKVVTAAQSELDQILLPHQKERLKQITVQSQLRRQDTSEALTSGALAEQLGITDEQKEKLRAKQEEVQASIREKFEKIRQEAQNDLFSVLTPEQQAKLKSMIGSPITFSPPQFGFGGGGPGGPGGRGPGGPGGGPGGNAPLRRPADGD